MDTEQLEKELQIWDRLMYMAVGASIVLAALSFRHLDYADLWPGFQSYAGAIWQWMQMAITPPGFYLLWSKRWKDVPFQEKKNTIIGFFIASWFTFLALGFITLNYSLVLLGLLFTGSAALITLGYLWWRKVKPNQVDEMFP
jgi:hypothetical protein